MRKNRTALSRGRCNYFTIVEAAREAHIELLPSYPCLQSKSANLVCRRRSMPLARNSFAPCVFACGRLNIRSTIHDDAADQDRPRDHLKILQAGANLFLSAQEAIAVMTKATSVKLSGYV